MITLNDIRFRSCVRFHEKSALVGFADVTLVVEDVLEGDALELRLRQLEIKVTEKGPRFDFKSERGRDGEFYPLAFPKNGKTREALTNALLSDPLIAAAIKIVQEERAAA